MKIPRMSTLMYLVIAMVLIGLVLMPKERFQPEFLDKTGVDRTVQRERSSHEQLTNHMDPAAFNAGPIAGNPTIFRVNQYSSYVV